MMNIGDIVTLTVSCLGNKPGAIGVVYEEYYTMTQDRGVSIIFENGQYDGFSKQEQKDYLKSVGYFDELRYSFFNVTQLSREFNKGTFSKAFTIGRKIIGERDYNNDEAQFLCELNHLLDNELKIKRESKC